jgi:hypothetical protein
MPSLIVLGECTARWRPMAKSSGNLGALWRKARNICNVSTPHDSAAVQLIGIQADDREERNAPAWKLCCLGMGIDSRTGTGTGTGYGIQLRVASGESVRCG